MNDPLDDGPESLTGAFALDAVTPREREALAQALAGSESLRTEVTELTDTAVELGLAIPPVTPPASLRASILDAVESLPQDVSRRRSRPAAESGGRWSRLGVVLAAAAAVLGLVAGGIAIGHFTNPMTVLANSQDMEKVTDEVDGGGIATVMWSKSMGQAAVTVEGIGPLPRDFVYQLWYMGDTVRPAGTFTEDMTMLLQGELLPGDEIGISIEPAGGSPEPTSTPILAVQT